MDSGPDTRVRRCLALISIAFFVFGALPASSERLLAQEIPAMSATYQIEKGTRRGWLIVTVEIPEDCHIYALTQTGSPPPTKIKLAESKQFTVLEVFRADKEPHVVENDPVFGQRVETYEAGTVKLIAPISVAEGVKLEEVTFDLKFHGQVCSGEGCKPIFNHPLTVSFNGFYDPPPPVENEDGGKKKDGTEPA
jgi:Disulphide bond corrector protein DsbC